MLQLRDDRVLDQRGGEGKKTDARYFLDVSVTEFANASDSAGVRVKVREKTR